MKGVPVQLYTTRSDQTDRPRNVYLFDPELTTGNFSLDEVRELTPEALCLKLVRREICGGHYLHAEPFDRPDGVGGPMFGGAYVFTSDSRLRDIAEYPIPLHDHFETPDNHALLSR